MASAIQKPPSVQDPAQPFGQKTKARTEAQKQRRLARAEAKRKSEANAKEKADMQKLLAVRAARLKARTQAMRPQRKVDVMA